jgi:TetR/AcrR family transcriptional regulator, cholesterol catabolism regulator
MQRQHSETEEFVMLRATKKHIARREKVIDAAAEVFAAKGFHGASTADIAELIGIQQGSLYYYFDSKETALQEVCELGMGAYLEAVREIGLTEGGVAAKIRALVTNHIEALDGALPYIRTYLYESRALSAERSHRLNQMHDAYERILGKILADGVENGELPPKLDCALASLYIMSMFNTVAVHRDRQQDMSVEQLIQGIAAMILGGIHCERWMPATAGAGEPNA